MELGPPSYSAATSRNHWLLVVPYIRSADLPAACLVDKSWHQNFAAQLWGNPMQNSEYRFSDPWFGLRKFEQILLHVARLEVRQWTHTLDVPVDIDSLHIEIGSKWLYNLVSRLPRLQSILVKGVPLFDQKTVSALLNSLNGQLPTAPYPRDRPNLRLLDASNCENMSEEIVSRICQMFPDFAYLDISGIPIKMMAPSQSPSSPFLLESLRSLRNLKVLKLQGCRLNDNMVKSISAALGKRVRSLDIRNNPITSNSLESLLNRSFVQLEDSAFQDIGRTVSQDQPPTYAKHESNHQRNGKGLEERLYDALTSGHIEYLALEDNTEPGITQLKISVQGGASLKSILRCMDCPNLRYLDVQSPFIEFDTVDDKVPANSNIEYLRVNHQFVTKVSASRPTTNEIDDLMGLKLNLPKVLEIRRRRSTLDQTDFTNLIPNLPKLQMLVLVGIPEQSTNLILAKRLISLLQNCAIDASLAKAQAHFEFSTNSTIKNFKSSAEVKRANALSTLNVVALELISGNLNSQSSTSKGWNYPTDTRAVTGDKDSTSMWGFANEDYSFFDNVGYDEEPDTRLDKPVSHSRTSHAYNEANVVDAIVNFRKESRQKYADAVARGKALDVVHEHWDATVSLWRN